MVIFGVPAAARAPRADGSNARVQAEAGLRPRKPERPRSGSRQTLATSRLGGQLWASSIQNMSRGRGKWARVDQGGSATWDRSPREGRPKFGPGGPRKARILTNVGAVGTIWCPNSDRRRRKVPVDPIFVQIPSSGRRIPAKSWATPPSSFGHRFPTPLVKVKLAPQTYPRQTMCACPRHRRHARGRGRRGGRRVSGQRPCRQPRPP